MTEFECSKCKKQFISLLSLERHTLTHSSKPDDSEILNKFIKLTAPLLEFECMSTWIKTATLEEIVFAIECGYSSVFKLRNYKKYKAIAEKQSNPDNLQQVNNSNTNTSSINNNDINNTTNNIIPAIKGKIGEQEIEDIIKKVYPSATNTSSNKMSGDLQLNINNNKIIIEVKNYTNNVPYATVEKFKRDLNISNSLGGIFISLQSPIDKIYKTMSIVYENGIPCIYVISRDPDVILCCISLISSAIEAQIYKNNSLSENDLALIDKNLSNILKHRHSLYEASSTIHKEITHIGTLLSLAEIDLKNILDKIRVNIPVDVVNIDDIFVNNKNVSG